MYTGLAERCAGRLVAIAASRSFSFTYAPVGSLARITATSNAMGDLQHLCGALAYNNAWRHGVAGCDPRHNGTVSDTQVVDPIDIKFAVYDRHGIAAHLGSAGLVPVCDNAISNKGFQRFSLHPPWYHLALYEWPQRSGVRNLAAELHTLDHRLQIIRDS
jgi:hypothetical protein